MFRRIDEDTFAVLYSEKGSRPNTPVNVLVGLEILKEGRHWSDEELYNHLSFDMQVRYALGCEFSVKMTSTYTRCTTFSNT